MQFLKRIFEFYINSSIHIALAVCGLVWLSVLNFNLPLDEYLMCFIFFATITGYNFVKYFGLAKFHHRRLTNRLKIIQGFSLFSFIALCYFTFKLEFKTVLYISGFGIITFLYAIPFLPKKIFLEDGNLRAISGLKIYIIAFVWAGITVIIPVINENLDINSDVILTALQRYIYVMVTLLPFEIRDMQFDSLKLSTIPQRIGVKRTKIIGALLLIPFFLIEFFKTEISKTQVIIVLVVTVLILFFLVFSKIKQHKYYSSFWVESIPLLWLFLNILSIKLFL